MKKVFVLSVSLLMFCSFILTGCGSRSKSAGAKVIDIPLTDEEYAFGVDKNQPELLAKVNEFIAKIKSDGTLEKINNKYFGDGKPEPVTSAAQDSSKD